MAKGTFAIASWVVLLLLPAGCADDGVGAEQASSDGGRASGGGGASGGQTSAGASVAGGGGRGGDEVGGDGGFGGERQGPCPIDMEFIAREAPVCMDRFEAPNVAGALPLVMYSLLDGEAWCAARGKRVCADDEWTTACQGPEALAFPYGADHEPGLCNDDRVWKVYNQSLLNGWPAAASSPMIESFAQQLDVARALSPSGALAADHVEALYQAEPAGAKDACTGPAGVFDLCGNVEEWTARADGGDGGAFTGNLKGRYWAETRTCQQNVTNHADAFRFYETGFRCCAMPL